MNILITGSKGQLGSEFKNIKESFNSFNFFFTDIKECDITNKKSISNYIHYKNIYCIINCAAYTDVDNAEKEIEKAKKLNDIAVQNLVEICQENNIKLIHISTDYVFDGNTNKPYVESDLTNPLGVYGITKLEGEKKLINSNVDGIVIRTSWLYSSYAKNFVKTMIRLAKNNSEIRVVNDQFGCPTYAKDLVETCLKILLKNKKISSKNRLYHFSNIGIISWFEFAQKIFNFLNIDIRLVSVSSREFKSLAHRPNYSVFNKQRIIKDFNLKIPNWEESLKECLKKIR